MFTIWVLDFRHILSFWVLSQFKFLSFVTIWFFKFVINSVFDFCQNLSFWVLSKFEFLSFVTIWVFPCKHKENKVQHQKVTFLWRNIKDQRVIIWFLLLLASILDRFGKPRFNLKKWTIFKTCILKNKFCYLMCCCGTW